MLIGDQLQHNATYVTWVKFVKIHLVEAISITFMSIFILLHKVDI